MGVPYGVAGPLVCNQGGNVKILTHDFTHRTHMEIFKGWYVWDFIELCDMRGYVTQPTSPRVRLSTPVRPHLCRYYPAELVDWWMDTWVSRVYGSRRTALVQDVLVGHRTKEHGRRYTVNAVAPCPPSPAAPAPSLPFPLLSSPSLPPPSLSFSQKG